MILSEKGRPSDVVTDYRTKDVVISSLISWGAKIYKWLYSNVYQGQKGKGKRNKGKVVEVIFQLFRLGS